MITEDSENSKLPVLKSFFHGFLLAVSFLTRIPLKSSRADKQEVWKYSTAFYPLCGYIIAAVTVVPLFIILISTPKTAVSLLFVAPFFYVVVLQWMTRMLHFDGFCDCVDAFSAMSASQEKRLEIMKDPHIGSSAAAAGALLLIGKMIPLYLIVFLSHNAFTLISAMLAIPVLARLSMLLLAYSGKYPRKDGTALFIIGKVPLFSLIAGIISTLPVLYLLSLVSMYTVLASLAAVLISFFYWKIKADRKIGGVTGDVLGACCESAELLIAFSLLIS